MRRANLSGELAQLVFELEAAQSRIERIAGELEGNVPKPATKELLARIAESREIAEKHRKHLVAVEDSESPRLKLPSASQIIGGFVEAMGGGKS